MYRPRGSLLLSLPVALVLTAGAAQAQSVRQSDPLQGLMGLFRSEAQTEEQRQAQMQPLSSSRIESESLPPPGFATPNGAPPPIGQDGAAPVGNQMGHQFGDQPRYAPPPASANAGPDAVRPPGVIGGGPSAAPAPVAPNTVMTLPPEDQPEQGQPKELPEHLKKQLVDYTSKEPAGTIIVDTSNTYLYLVLGGGKALRYGIGVGREGFTWAGTERVSRMREWPDWHPPAEMIERQPYLPRMMAGGPGNPMGARALYLGNTLYRIHGTNQPSTIGSTVSSGCIRLLNEDIEDLFSRVQVGSRVVVLPGKAPETVAQGPQPPANPMAPPAATGSSINPAPLNAPMNTAPAPLNPPIMSAPVQQPRR